MSAEALRHIDYKKIQRGWMIATVVSAGLGYYGIKEGFVEPPSDPVGVECSDLTTQAYRLETQLFNDGTLGSDGGLIVRYLEIRNPVDPRIPEWGALKNRRDRICAQAQRNYQSSFGGLIRGAGLLGAAVTLLGIQRVLELRRPRPQNG